MEGLKCGPLGHTGVRSHDKEMARPLSLSHSCRHGLEQASISRWRTALRTVGLMMLVLTSVLNSELHCSLDDPHPWVLKWFPCTWEQGQVSGDVQQRITVPKVQPASVANKSLRSLHETHPQLPCA